MTCECECDIEDCKCKCHKAHTNKDSDWRANTITKDISGNNAEVHILC